MRTLTNATANHEMMRIHTMAMGTLTISPMPMGLLWIRLMMVGLPSGAAYTDKRMRPKMDEVNKVSPMNNVATVNEMMGPLKIRPISTWKMD